MWQLSLPCIAGEASWTIVHNQITQMNTVVTTTVYYIIFFSAHERGEFNKSCSLIGSGSGRNFLIRTATAGGIRRVDLFSWTN